MFSLLLTCLLLLSSVNRLSCSSETTESPQVSDVTEPQETSPPVTELGPDDLGELVLYSCTSNGCVQVTGACPNGHVIYKSEQACAKNCRQGDVLECGKNEGRTTPRCEQSCDGSSRCYDSCANTQPCMCKKGFVRESVAGVCVEQCGEAIEKMLVVDRQRIEITTLSGAESEFRLNILPQFHGYRSHASAQFDNGDVLLFDNYTAYRLTPPYSLKQLPSPNEQRIDASAVVDGDDTVLLCGGHSSGKHGLAGWQNSLGSCLQLRDDQWSATAFAMNHNRSIFAMVNYKREVFAIGGQAAGREPLESQPLDSVEKLVWPDKDNDWESVSPLRIARTHHAAVVWKDRIVVCGGVSPDSGYLQSCEQYDPSSDTWTDMPQMNLARKGLALAVSRDGHMYAVGGRTWWSEPDLTWRSVERFDEKLNSWILYEDVVSLSTTQTQTKLSAFFFK